MAEHGEFGPRVSEHVWNGKCEEAMRLGDGSGQFTESLTSPAEALSESSGDRGRCPSKQGQAEMCASESLLWGSRMHREAG